VARDILVVSALALLASLTSGCLTANPAYDGPDAGNGTSAAITTTWAGSTNSTGQDIGSSTTTTSSTTTLEGSDASTLGAGATTSDTSTGASTDDMQTSTTAPGTSTDPGPDTDAPASTGEGDDSLVLEASKTYSPTVKNYPGVLMLGMATPVTVPAELTVIVGNAGNHGATLTLTRPNKSEVTCQYTGGSSQANPSPGDAKEWDKGLGYLFSECSKGTKPGDVVPVVQLRLDIGNGASMHPPEHPQTTAVAVFPKN